MVLQGRAKIIHCDDVDELEKHQWIDVPVINERQEIAKELIRPIAEKIGVTGDELDAVVKELNNG